MSVATSHRDRIEALPITARLKQRIRMTAGCRDCDAIAKVPGAGDTFPGPTGNYQVMHNGVRVIEDCYTGRWMTELIRLMQGHHEPQEERAFHELLPYVSAGGTMLELGCYWAYYSLWFHRQIPAARLHLIEPDPRNLEVGKENFSLNDATGRFFQYSLGRESRPAEPFRCEDGLVCPVPSICVDDFLTENGIAEVDILLSDIQGAEVDMLAGAAHSIEQGKIRFLVLSTHHPSISNDPLTHEKCLQFLRQREAHVLAEHNVKESYSGDGLIVAALRPADRQLPAIEISRNRSGDSLFSQRKSGPAEARKKPLTNGRRRSFRDALVAWVRRWRRPETRQGRRSRQG